jgi:invasion protein IalB
MINRFRAAVAVATLAALAASAAVAQQPASPPPKAAPKAAPKAPAKAPAPAPAAPAAQAPAPGGPAATSGNTVGNQTLPVIYTPWVKICQKPPQPQPGQKDICITTRTGLLEIGQPVITAEIVAMEGDPKRVLRVTMPLGVGLAQGTQYYVDANQPKQTAFSTCMGAGCIADYDATDDVIATMKSGQNFVSRAFDLSGQLITLQLPLGPEFAKVYDGAATDPTVLQQQQKNIQDIVQKAQARVQQQQQQQQGATPPAAPAK